MITGIKKYPLDLTGTALSNRVEDERITLPRTKSRAFSPRNGPFFANDSFKLRALPSNALLIPGTDYEFLYLYESATFDAGQPICGIVHVKNPAYSGEFSYDYNLIGGEFSGNLEAINNAIASLSLDGRAVHWDDILDKPILFPAAPHLHHVNDLYGMEDLIEAINVLSGNVSEGDSLLKEQILLRMARSEESLVSVKASIADLTSQLQLVSDRLTTLEQGL